MEMVQRRCFTFLQCQIRSWILWQRTRMRLEPEIAEYSFFHYFFLQLQLPKIQLDRDRKSTSIFFGIEILKFQPLKVEMACIWKIAMEPTELHQAGNIAKWTGSSTKPHGFSLRSECDELCSSHYTHYLCSLYCATTVLIIQDGRIDDLIV